MATLIIENVNFEQLEEQRKALHKVIDLETLPDDLQEHLLGIESMLDHWSDQQYFKINSVI